MSTLSSANRTLPNPGKKTGMQKLLSMMWQQRYLYLLVIPGMASLILFSYVPIYGIQLAFKTYKVNLGIWGSPWNDFAHFERIFSDPDFWSVTQNTLIISLMKILTGFPVPIILALLLNEVRGTVFKRVSQTILYLPNFISWIVIASLIYGLFSTQVGVYGKVFAALANDSGWIGSVFRGLFGTKATPILGNPDFFRAELYLSSIWKGAGAGMIIYLAAISGVDPQLYESAQLDGAGRFKMMWHITLPALSFAITLNLIMAFGGVMNGNFDQIFNLYSPTVYKVGDTIDTFVYRMGIVGGRYDISTAVNLFKSVISAILLFGSDRVAKLLGQDGFF